MKRIEIKDILKKDLLVVELPRKADVEIFPNSIEIYNQFTGQEETIKGSYTLLGKADEIREEDARELVEAAEPYWDDNKNQKVIGNAKWSYTKSLLSLLKSEIYWENPFRITGLNKEYIELEDWDKNFTEAEHKTFDRNRTLIFVKN